jgi:hypothetical protein
MAIAYCLLQFCIQLYIEVSAASGRVEGVFFLLPLFVCHFLLLYIGSLYMRI